MSKGIIDVLPPYENEVLVSWIVRMLRHYSDGNRLTWNASAYMKELFGPDSTERPGLYFQTGLQYFAENCGLEDTKTFQSEYTMLQNMSVLPFYMPFCTDKQIKTLNKYFAKNDYYIHMETVTGIRINFRYLENRPYFKFCSLCLKEQSEIYLNREHQVQGNYVCWKHGCVLKKLPYNLEWKNIDFISNIEKNTNIIVPDIPLQNQNDAKVISYMIHSIFDGGFRDNLDVLKRKLLNRLYEFNIIDEKGEFYNFQDFAEGLNADFYYEDTRLKEEIATAIGVNSSINVNPIIYLILILRLFGGLAKYYDYAPTKAFKLISKNKIYNRQIDQRMNDIDYYVKKNESLFYKYSILGDTKDDIIVKHLSCESIYRFSKKYKNFKHCKNCKNCDDLFDKMYSVSYTRYLSTEEYGIIHNKKVQQIRNYCKQDRLPGVIRIGVDYLIPENVPFPERNRVSKKETEQIYFEYWSAFNDYAFAKSSYSKVFNKRKPLRGQCQTLHIGTISCFIMFNLKKKNKKISTELYIKENKEIFKKLYANKDEIERELGLELEWCELPNKKASKILLSKDYDCTNKNTWNEQFEWLMDMSMRFRQVFKKYI